MKQKKGLFRHLAWNGIKKNYKLYAPYILAAAGMAAMFYIILSLGRSSFLIGLGGAATAILVLRLGVVVIGVFAVIFMFYTNSFLIRTRTREFGLYNILGMSRRHISRIVAIETLMAAGLSLAGGLIVGILFEKLAELFFVRLIGEQTTYAFTLDFGACLITAGVFLAIFLLVMLRSMFRIYRQNTIELLKAENFGEKPPRAKWVLTLVGILLLGGAYVIAVLMAAPLQAITMFFFAVIMVIVATFILFISGSVSVCRALQKNKKYFYKTKHFVSLSSMVYRMKRNGAGLASICILSTMVLVMISSTSCLYFGKEASLNARYPREFDVDIRMEDGLSDEKSLEIKDTLRSSITQTVNSFGTDPVNVVEAEMVYASVFIRDGVMTNSYSPLEMSLNDSASAWDVYFVTLESFNRYMGENRTLADDEVILCTYLDEYEYDTITVPSGRKYTIVDSTKDFFKFGEIASDISPAVIFVAKSLPALEPEGIYREVLWYYLFDVDADEAMIADIYDGIIDSVSDVMKMYQEEIGWFTGESRTLNRSDFFGMYGGLFFLGIALSIVFTFALVLILYYKQISEGYEDRSRFEIMRKVGMTDEDIRKSVNSQMGNVFYMPLVAAVIHLGFAIPMIFSMLKLFSVTEFSALVVSAVLSVVAFGIIYTVVYKITSNSYYKLVA